MSFEIDIMIINSIIILKQELNIDYETALDFIKHYKNYKEWKEKK